MSAEPVQNMGGQAALRNGRRVQRSATAFTHQMRLYDASRIYYREQIVS
jgi:hypothetical protein